ncbi:LADA_0H05512g1_1 [Lachancea dasiensis]|uniref:LADA_0H05512g1_1 n=1 Tax=Lachancea dasiensis TaxID=1072105 RepID=A0A1G4K195_9SACH|nr:LADA_0H05512g1_1 [Lachancea dasiensis]
MSDERSYRMLVLLEDGAQNSGCEQLQNGEKPDQSAKVSHEFVDELILPFDVEEMDKLNLWFDKFDSDICIPNEGFIKYEISSDGLVVLLLDRSREEVVAQVRRFVESTLVPEATEHNDNDEESN